MKAFDGSAKEVITRAIIKSIISIISITAPGAGLANIVIDGTKELSTMKNNKEEQISSYIRENCEKTVSECDRRYFGIICATTEICLRNFDIFSNTYTPKESANRLCNGFIRTHKNQYDDGEIEILRKRLPAVLENVIPELEKMYEDDLDFRVKWRKNTSKVLKDVEQKIADNTEQIENLKLTIETQKEKTERPTPKVAELRERYEQKWDEKLFLDDKRTLSQVYQLPCYQHVDYWPGEDDEENDDANCYDDLSEQLQTTLSNCNNTDQRMLVVLGHPGSGKSTLITYLLNNCQIQTDRDVRVYRFSGFNDIDWNKNIENLPQLMLNEMGLIKSDLNDSVMILDGLDEIAMHGGHEDFLNDLFRQWAKSKEIKRFSLIITCRRNRIYDISELQMPYMLLCPLNSQQIEQFANAYWGKKTKQFTLKEKTILNKITNTSRTIMNVMGIPLILYMSLALEIDFSEETGLCDIYAQIFSTSNKDNSIYYRKYDKSHPITSNEAGKIHEFSKRIAELIWEFNPEKGTVEKEQYDPVASSIANGECEGLREILVGQYFMEGADGCQLLFVHRSMFEYFVALSIYNEISEIVDSGHSNEWLFRKGVSKLAKFANLFGMQNIMDYPDIQDFLLYMLNQNPLGDSDWWVNFFEHFLKFGLADAAEGRKKGGVSGIEEELNRFYNLIWLTREQLRSRGKSAPFILSDKLCESIYLRIPYNGKKDLRELYLKDITLMGYDFIGARLNRANLCNAVLTKADFSEADLSAADLLSANMQQANLSYAFLAEARLQRSDLKYAQFINSILENADLSGADLANADFTEANLSHTKFSGAILTNARFGDATIFDTNFDRTNMRGVSFDGIALNNSSFIETDFTNAILTHVKISKKTPFKKAVFNGSKLAQADFCFADLSNAKFEGAEMQEIDLHNSVLVNTNLRGADLSGSNLKEADLTGALLKDAICDNAIMVESNLTKTDLRDATLTHTDLTNAILRGTKVGANTLDNIICDKEDYGKWELDHSLDFGQRRNYPEKISHLSDSIIEVDNGIFADMNELEAYKRFCEEDDEFYSEYYYR